MSSFRINNCSGAAYYTSVHLDKEKGVRHFFSSRIGGVSTGVYESLNLGVYTDDSSGYVKENIRRVFSSAGMSWKNAAYLKQVHGNSIYEVTASNLNQIRGLEGDGLITRDANIPIGIFTADCVPILLYDRVNKIAAALHGGWKGTDLGIAKKAIEIMCTRMCSSPENVLAAIGPCIGKCCFEVGEDVSQRFSLSSERNGRLYVDLALENINQLKDCGVPENNISNSGICTYCSRDTLFSYRRDKGATGRMGSFIEII
jgi:YfiH family protein